MAKEVERPPSPFTARGADSTVVLCRVEPNARDRSGPLTALTTEHFTLQGIRSGTITESLGRSTTYLGSLSASLVALAQPGVI